MLKHVRRHHDFMWTYLKALLKGLTRPALIFLAFFANTLILIFAYLFYWLEAGVNPTLTSFLDAIYFAVSTMATMGFGDIHPVTAPGKILAIVMMLMGTGFYVSFTAVLASMVMEIEQSLRNNVNS